MAKITQHYITHLRKVQLAGYKSIKQLSVDFLPGLNVLIGKNNAGKTNFLEGLSSVLDIYSRRKTPFASAQLELVSSNSEVFIWNVIRPKDDKGINSVGYPPDEQISKDGDVIFDTSSFDNIDNYKISRELLLEPLSILSAAHSIKLPVWNYVEFNIPNDFSLLSLKEAADFKLVRNINDMWLVGHSHPISPLKYFSQQSIINLLSHPISGTPNAIRELIISTLQFSHKDRINRFSPIEDIRLHENVNVYQDEDAIRISNFLLEFKVSGTWMPWSNLSDGTKRIFYLLSEVARIEHGVVLVDEPELGLYPDQFHQVMQFLQEEAEQKQIIVSTHAPQALDFIAPEELSRIFVASYTKEKGTQIQPLTEEQQEKARSYMNEELFLRDYWIHSGLEV